MASRSNPWIVAGLVLGALLLIVLFIAGYVRSTYNELVSQQGQIKTAWAQVENQLQRRYDLIPNPVETVKGDAKQETTIFTPIADARAWVGFLFRPPPLVGGGRAAQPPRGGDFQLLPTRGGVLFPPSFSVPPGRGGGGEGPPWGGGGGGCNPPPPPPL